MTHVPTNTFTDLEFALLNRFQRDFPLVSRPFAALAQQLDISENCVIGHLQQLQDRGAISRVGAAFRPNAIGASALAAVKESLGQNTSGIAVPRGPVPMAPRQ